jgi:tetratricopeptide (TPR) repeat protein
MKTVFAFLISFVSVIAYSQDAGSLIKEGIELHDAGEYNKAVEKYLEALKIDPQNATAYYEAGFSYHLAKDYDNALKMIDKAIELGDAETKLGATVIKGSILDETGRKKESAKFYEEALKTYPDHYLLWFNYGVTLMGLQRFDEAEKAYTNGLNLKINHPGSHLQLGNLNRIENKKATSALSFYFFLLLENNTSRSADAATKLLTMIYGDPADSTKNEKTIFINAETLGPKGNPSILGSAELYFGMMGVASGEIDKQTGSKRTQPQRFANDTHNFFQVLKELRENEAKEARSKKKKKKKSQGPESNFYLDHYVPFFTALNEAGHSEAFSYYVMNSLRLPEVDEWMKTNKDQMERFYTWVKTR